MPNTNAIISTIAKIHNGANKLIIQELKKNNLEGLVPSHGDILNHLYQNEAGLLMNEISNRINKDKSTVTALINKLEKLELIERVKSKRDSRSTIIKLTQKGLDTKPVIINDISVKLLEQTYQGFTQEEKEQLCTLLEKMKQNYI